jgi:phosphoglycolate phosphatase-like HAD superfamily hydrolase
LGAGGLDGAVVAFDLDGTLVDTAPDLVGTLNVILAEEGLRPLAMAHARDLIGHGARRLIERGFQRPASRWRPNAWAASSTASSPATATTSPTRAGRSRAASPPWRR